MKKTVMTGVALGSLSVPAIIAVLLAVDPIGELRPGLDPTIALPPAAAVPQPEPTRAADDPKAPSTTRPTVGPSRNITTPPSRPATADRRLDAADATNIIGKRFAGARVVEVELEQEGEVLAWEMTFLLHGGENEILVDTVSGELFGHEVGDDDDED
jgi:hypothetical protein